MYEEVNLTPVTLTFGLVTPNLIGFLCYPIWMCGPSPRRVGQGILELLNGNSFETFDPGDLDFDPVTPKSIRFLCWLVCGPSLRKVHQGVLQLLIGNKKVTDGQTDRHMQSNMPSSSSKGGHRNP